MPDSKQESRREVAEDIVNQIAVGAWQFQSPGWVVNAIEAALEARDERAAKIAERHSVDQPICTGPDCGVVIAAAIRNETTK